jgi:hypothetical protein
MSMQSHLAELERRHQALEDEISECLTHPAVDDLKIVELKRRKLQVKDEIERLRQNGRASVHWPLDLGQIFDHAELGYAPSSAIIFCWKLRRPLELNRGENAMSRLAAVVISAVALMFAMPEASAGADYPVRPVTLVVPYPPGGGVDAMARVVAAKLSDALRQ